MRWVLTGHTLREKQSFRIGVRLANFHRIGTLCCFNEEFSIRVSIGARYGAKSFQNQYRNPSGPDPVRFKFIIAFLTSFTFTVGIRGTIGDYYRNRCCILRVRVNRLKKFIYTSRIDYRNNLIIVCFSACYFVNCSPPYFCLLLKLSIFFSNSTNLVLTNYFINSFLKFWINCLFLILQSCFTNGVMKGGSLDESFTLIKGKQTSNMFPITLVKVETALLTSFVLSRAVQLHSFSLFPFQSYDVPSHL